MTAAHRLAPTQVVLQQSAPKVADDYKLKRLPKRQGLFSHHFLWETLPQVSRRLSP